MKRYIFIPLLFSMGLWLSGCGDYLDVDQYFNDRLNETKVFENKDYSEQWLAGVYSRLAGANADVASKGHTPFNFSDDMYFGDRSGDYAKFKNGMYDEEWRQTWGLCYEGIRDASIFIRNIDINKELSPDEIADMKAQARFLRAYYYWLLLRKYGPVPVLPEEGLDYTLDYDGLSLPRNTYDECAEFIDREMALAAKDLPLSRTTREIARPTRGAALAARAKALLYAASPLANGNTEMSDLQDDEGRCLIAQTYDERKWAKAAAAALEVIRLNVYELYTAPVRSESGGPGLPKTVIPPYDARYSDKNFPEGWKDIDPFESYRQIFNGAVSAEANPELIFSRVQNQSTEGIEVMVLHQMPISLKGWNTHGMTQKQCDAYTLNTGEEFPASNRPEGFTTLENIDQYPELHTHDKNLSLGISLQYARREPRFYASVAYSGSVWECRSAQEEQNRNNQVFYYRGLPNGIAMATPEWYLRTGIGIKKYYNPDDSFLSDESSKRVAKPEPAIRYAEVLLIYAEAMNELKSAYDIPAYDGSGTITVSRNTAEMSKYISQIRIRAGLPDFDANVYASADAFRKALKHERQVELFAEGHRYFDLRRWKDAPVEEATPIYGCNMYMTESQRAMFYSPVVIPSLPTVFVKKMYFWPISHSELKKNKRLTQNPGWTYYD